MLFDLFNHSVMQNADTKFIIAVLRLSGALLTTAVIGWGLWTRDLSLIFGNIAGSLGVTVLLSVRHWETK